jgi:hypothetical protein
MLAGSRDLRGMSGQIDVADGSTTGEAAVLRRAFVDHPGQLPG